MAKQVVRRSQWPSNWGNPSSHWHCPWIWMCWGCGNHEGFASWEGAIRHADDHPATCPGEWQWEWQ
ncbi:hypothetical protein J2S59_000320 [Nocardioides massiliensis]|uniref:C2H2-type domain-containing protein n=1 Tax=Nocardioides massiliensis TaxID=1325935 RepID=A0ABT9NJB6_9ACTN|nr:hypothetical protein [Nocardioides massiliensis]